MKTITPTLQAFLNANQQTLMADLYTFTLVGGYVARYTSADVAISSGGHTFIANDVVLTRGTTKVTTGVQVETLEVLVSAATGNLLNGVPWLQAARLGALDGASLTLERAFMSSWGDTSMGTVIMFSGRVSDVEITRLSAKITVRSSLELLNVQMPRDLYQPGCLSTLYDIACGINKASLAVTATVSSGATRSVIPVSATNPTGYFALGTIAFTSGANNGITRSVKSYTPGLVTVSVPLEVAPSNGDTITLHPGCDKQQSTCSAKFSNLNNFRGFPYIPTPESASSV